MTVFYNSPINYEGPALEQMRLWLGNIPCFTISWVSARARDIDLDPRTNTQVVK